MTRAIAFAMCVLGAASPASAQDLLDPVRLLYASAEYEEALTTLGRLRTEAAAEEATEIDRYRALCLIALGRSAEADKAIESIVKADPLFQPAPAEASPRVRAAFDEVRRRLLPGIVRSSYAEAKAAYDRDEFEDAAQKLERTLRVLDDPDAGSQPELADLRVLITGFLDLSKAALEKSAGASASAAAKAPAAQPPPPVPPTIIEPVVIRQELPPWTVSSGSPTRGEFRGMIEVDIDERGNVMLATLTDSVHPQYDPLLLNAARDWQYQPARRNGQPVKSRKRVEVVLRDK
jgi:tetratricopeptide (TPR) repeat protein